MKKNTKQPKIRFKGFSGDWEQRKLNDICTSFEYGLNVAGKYFDGKNKYIRITDINDEMHSFNTDDLTTPDVDLDKVDNYRLEKNDILFARTGASVGKTYIYRESDGIVYYAGFLIRAKIKDTTDAEFVFQNTLSFNYARFVRLTSQRSGQPGINAKEYSEYCINIPNKNEQKKIGIFFRNIDQLISLHQRKSKLYQNHRICLFTSILCNMVANL